MRIGDGDHREWRGSGWDEPRDLWEPTPHVRKRLRVVENRTTTAMVCGRHGNTIAVQGTDKVWRLACCNRVVKKLVF